MPGPITHILLAKSALSMTSPGLRALVLRYEGFFNIGAQGPDIFFYYPKAVISGRLKGIGSQMHEGGAGEFFEKLALTAKNAVSPLRETLTAFLCGYISHRTLDDAAHPYVYSKTGFIKPGEKGDRVRILSDHWHFETCIDTLTLRLLTGRKTAEIRLWEELASPQAEFTQTADAVAGAIACAYVRDINGVDIGRAVADMRRFTRMMRSPTGRLKKVLETVERGCTGKRLLSALICGDLDGDGTDYMNMEKTLWAAPWDETAKSNLSFMELFDIAAVKAAAVMDKQYKIIYSACP